MKESEFIELLNLYLDHEISAADAVRLETEVQNNQARRQVYQQYCRMQKACKMLTADFQTEPAVAGPERKIIAFNPAAAEAIATQRRRNNIVYTLSTMAAAACIAVIFVNRADRPKAAPAGRETAPHATIVNSTPAAAQPSAVVANSAGPRALGKQPKLVTDPLLLTGSAQEPLATSDANDQFKWVTSLQLAPLPPRVPAEELRFDARPATLRPDARVLGANRAPAEANVEMTAFRFVK